MSFETAVLFNATISFKDRDAAGRFLEALSNVVEQSVAVFHGRTQRPAALERELATVGSLLPHFVENVERGDDGDRDLDIARGATQAAAENISRLLSALREGPRGGGGGWSDDQRFTMAELFKGLFEHLVVLMQLSEAQQAKGLVKNIRLTQQMLTNVCDNSGRVSMLHNANLRQAVPVLVRAAGNRAEVVQDPDMRAKLEDVRRGLDREGKLFCDWIDSGSERSSRAGPDLRQQRGAELQRLLDRFRALVAVRIASEADFGYKYLSRQQFDTNLDDLLAAAKSGDKAKVVEAAKAVNEVVKAVEAKELDDDSQLKKDARELLTQAQLALNGSENQLELAASRIKEDHGKLAEKEEQIRGKPLYGQLPSAIQSMAALLKTREAQQAKPKAAAGSVPQAGAKAPESRPAREEPASASGPGYGIIASTKNNNNK